MLTEGQLWKDISRGGNVVVFTTYSCMGSLQGAEECSSGGCQESDLFMLGWPPETSE